MKTGDPNDLIGEKESRSPIYLSWMMYVNELQRVIKESFTDKKILKSGMATRKIIFIQRLKGNSLKNLYLTF